MSSKETEKQQPEKHVVLGLDISTACIGISIVEYEDDKEPEILKITHVVPKIKKGIDGIEALILRKAIFEDEFLMKHKDFGITECVIESPLVFATGNSNAQTVSQLLQFNGLLSEAVYRVLGIIPDYISSYDARMCSFPELMSIRKFNKKGNVYPLSHIKKDIKDNHLVLFGSYPFDCDKKTIMMNMVNEKYPDIKWIYNSKGNIKKENYDACDSLVCALAYINKKKYGEFEPKVASSCIEINDSCTVIDYMSEIWGKQYNKRILIEN